jgi:hypothetical protein
VLVGDPAALLRLLHQGLQGLGLLELGLWGQGLQGLALPLECCTSPLQQSSRTHWQCKRRNMMGSSE